MSQHFRSHFYSKLRLTVVISTLVGVNSLSLDAAPGTRWVCYYADTASISAFDKFDLAVLDSDASIDLHTLADRGKQLVGYLSIGEAEQTRSYFPAVKSEGILLQENKDWEGSFFVDVRDPRWTKRIIEDLIPNILRKGFEGVFLDTVDNAPHLERTDPVRYKGMSAGMVNLIKTIRKHFPHITLIMNRGFEILPKVENEIEMVLGESIFADYDFASKQYRLVPSAEYQEHVRLLKEARKRKPQLSILTLDYWNPADPKGIARIYREQRANGFNPYVATIALDRIVEEPKH